MDDEQTAAGLQRQAWLDLKAHVCRALADPTTDADSLRGVLLVLKRAGVEVPDEPPPQRARQLAGVA